MTSSQVPSAAEVVADMIAAMKVAEPQLDTSIGSVARKIFDVVGEQIAPAYAIGYLQDWIYSIETKEGAALDDYVNQFGIFRIPAKRAIGLVTFARDTPATANITIPANTVVLTGSTPQVSFVTTAAGYLLKGTKEVTVPVQAVLAGTAGNLPVGSLTLIGQAISGIRIISQADATSGGTEAESDAALRDRFRKTVFRNLAGTEDMFLGLALEDTVPDDDANSTANHAVVIGPSRRWHEQVQIEADGSATSVLPTANAKHIYNGSAVLGDDIDGGLVLTENVHYDFVPTVPPEVTSVEDNLDEGAVYELEFEYVSSASRNDPITGITNRVDIWVAGVDPQTASEVTYWQPQTFVGDANDPMWWGHFVRTTEDTGLQRPANGNAFLQLAWGPIVEFPERLVIDGVDYVNGTDFWVVHDESAFGLGPNSKFGLEFNAMKVPALNEQIVLTGSTGYFYNRLPSDIEQRIRRWKLVTTDVVVHQARYVRIILNLAIMYDPSFERGVVQSGIDNALGTWIDQQGFGTTLQVSDILQVAHSVSGADNVRLLTSDERAIDEDADSWGIQVVADNGVHISHLATTGLTPNRAKDWVLQDNQVPLLYDIRYVTKAQNSFGVA